MYLDPPYTRTPQNAYGVYGYGSFSAHDMERMLETLGRLDQDGATFLFSYADVLPLVDSMPSRWSVQRIRAPGQIAANAAARSPRAEVLVSNREPALDAS